MTNAAHPGHVTDTFGDRGDSNPEALKEELFAAWSAANPGGTRQQFEDAWVATTNDPPPSTAAARAPTTPMSPASEEQDPAVLKRRMFEEWIAARPTGTREQFESEWDAITSIRGV